MISFSRSTELIHSPPDLITSLVVRPDDEVIEPLAAVKQAVDLHDAVAGRRDLVWRRTPHRRAPRVLVSQWPSVTRATSSATTARGEGNQHCDSNGDEDQHSDPRQTVVQDTLHITALPAAVGSKQPLTAYAIPLAGTTGGTAGGLRMARGG